MWLKKNLSKDEKKGMVMKDMGNVKPRGLTRNC